MLLHLAGFSGVNADTNKDLLDLLSKVYLVAVVALGALIIGFALSLVTGGTTDGRPATTPATERPTPSP